MHIASPMNSHSVAHSSPKVQQQNTSQNLEAPHQNHGAAQTNAVQAKDMGLGANIDFKA